MYDWANSAFATTVMAGFFPIFFKQYWGQGVEVTKSTAMLGVANSVAGIGVAAVAPILGAIADSGSHKKKFLVFFAYLGVLSTAGLYFVQRGEWIFAVLMYALGTIGFSGGIIFYDSLLPSIAKEKNFDVVSAIGYAMGYLGGGLLFALNVWMVLSPQTFGFSDSSQAVKVSFLTVAIWWGVFTIPIILLVPEPDLGRKPTHHSIRSGFGQILRTFKKIRHLKMVFLFLLAYWLYIDGVDTIIRMAVDYGLSIGFRSQDLIVALLITQFIGFPSAIAFGFLGKKIGAKRAIFLGIAVYIFVVFWAMGMDKPREFYVLAGTVGLVQGGVQALSRSLYSRLIPLDQSAEFFGFYNLLGKFSVIMGPLVIGLAGLISKNPRVGIGSILIFFILGSVLLYFVDERKGAEEAKYLQLH